MRKLLLLLCALLFAATPVLADTIYSNLGDPPSYNCCTGWSLTGPNSRYKLIRDAEQFTAGISGDVGQIDLGLGWAGGTNGATVSLWTSANDFLGTKLGAWSVGNIPTLGSTSTTLVTISGITGVNVNAGSKYFLVVEAASDFIGVWNFDTLNDTALLLQDSGSGWNQFPGRQIGAFDLKTSGGAVPEPGTFVMLGSGICALAGAIRRRSA